MKSLRQSRRGSAAILCLLPLVVAASAIVAKQAEPVKQDELSPAAARAAIGEGSKKWSRARVEYDKQAMETLTAPDFYVSLYGKKIDRETFIRDCSTKGRGARLTRFETEILTVRKDEKGWTVVIGEKVEYTIPGKGGEARKVYSYWVTRDGWRQEGEKWLCTYSEAIGHENWRGGSKPPISGW